MYRAHVRNVGGALVTTFYRVRLRNRSAGTEVVLHNESDPRRRLLPHVLVRALSVPLGVVHARVIQYPVRT